MEEIIEIYKEQLEKLSPEKNVEDPVINQEKCIQAFISTIGDAIKQSRDTTIRGFYEYIKESCEGLLKNLIQKDIIKKGRVAFSLEAVSNVMVHLFHKYSSQKTVEDLNIIKEQLVKITDNLVSLTKISKDKIAKLFTESLTNNMTILVCGYSNKVLHSLIYARKKGKIFRVYITQNNEYDSSKIMYEKLKENDVTCKLISGVSVGFYLKDVDIVLTGADAVCESGGIINKIGTYTTAICAKSFNKPFYALVDSLKFMKIYILNQNDLQQTIKGHLKISDDQEILIDYTSPDFITLFFSEFGILTPNAISDQLIQMFYN